jgi:hypothetical protein
MTDPKLDPRLKPAYDPENTIDEMWEVFQRTMETMPHDHPLRAIAKSSFGAGAVTMITWLLGVINREDSTADQDLELMARMGTDAVRFTQDAISEGRNAL